MTSVAVILGLHHLGWRVGRIPPTCVAVLFLCVNPFRHHLRWFVGRFLSTILAVLLGLPYMGRRVGRTPSTSVAVLSIFWALHHSMWFVGWLAYSKTRVVHEYHPRFLVAAFALDSTSAVHGSSPLFALNALTSQHSACTVLYLHSATRLFVAPVCRHAVG